jgi:hypothetical protein
MKIMVFLQGTILMHRNKESGGIDHLPDNIADLQKR